MRKMEWLRWVSLLSIGFLTTCLTLNVSAQGREVAGTVRSADDGKPLPGVNIVIKGTMQGTTANVDGEYSITVHSNSDVLVFTSVGFQPMEVEVGTQRVINVNLKIKTEEFDELVVTALGLKSEKKSLGYSTQEVSGQSLTEARETNFASGLKGKVAGVQVSQSPTPGGSTGIIIRGASSLTGNNQPLIVVDGVPIDNQVLGGSDTFGGQDYGDGLGDIDPSNIEELTILKGPNATALYGARAANGAIVITTKSGENREGVGVSINSHLTFDKFMDFPTFQNKYATGYSKDINDWGTDTYNGEEYPVPSTTVDNWGPPLDGTMVLMPDLKDMGPVPLLPESKNNIENFFDTGYTLNNTVAVDGGNERTTYRFSVSDLNNKGTVPLSTYKENTFTLRLSSNITDKLFVDGKANYIHSKGENRPNVGIGLAGLYPNMLFFPRYVSLDWLKDYKDEDGNYRNFKSSGYPLNPYWLLNEQKNESNRDRLIGFVSSTYDFTDWLNLMVRSGIDTYSDGRSARVSQGTPRSGYENGYISNQTYKVEEINADFLLTADRDFSQDINGRLSFGGSYLHRETGMTGNTGDQLAIKGIYDISNAGHVTPLYFSSRKEIQSLYAMGHIGFRDYLFLDVSGRNDWSSTLGVENRSYFYPSASMSFVFSDAFGMNSPIFSFGKVRASYAQTGKDASPYQTQQGYHLSTSTIAGQREGYIDGQIAALSLKNELTKSVEFGTDLRFLNSRLNLDVTYYHEATFNQILPVNVSTASGFNTRVINSGELQNSGIEVMLDATPVQVGSFSWNFNVNYSRNKSKVVSLASGIDTQLLVTGAGVVTIEARPGEPYGNIIGYPFKRNDEGQLVLTDGGSPQRADDKAVLGNIQPDWLGGITNTFRYKGFELSGLIDISWGGQMYSFSKYDETAKGTGVFTENRESPLVYPGVIDNGDGTYSKNTNDLADEPYNYYAMHAWGNIGEYFVVDASYVTLREMTFGYNFQPSFLEKTPFSSLKLSVVGRNLLYLHRGEDLAQMGISPESFSSREASSRGYEARNFPLSRTIGFNLNVKF